MREGWVETTLGEVSRIQQGKTLAVKNMAGGDHPVYGANGVIGWHDSGNSSERTVALGCRGSCGTVFVAEPGAWLANNVMAVTPLAEAAEVEYLALVLEVADLVSTGVISGQVQPQITRASLSPLPVHLPPLDEQHRIVDLIASVDENIGAAERVGHEALQSLQSLSAETWARDERVRIGDLGVATTGSTPSMKQSEYWGSADVPFVTPGDLGDHIWVAETERFLSHEGASVSRRLEPFSVVEVCIASLGKVGVVPGEACTNQQINSIGGLSENDAVFLWLVMRSSIHQSELRSLSGQTAVPIVKKSSWVEMELPWPDESSRVGISGLARGLDDLRSAAEETGRAFRRLRSSLLTELLSGDHEIPESYDRVLEAS